MAPKPPVHPTALSLAIEIKATHVSIRASNVARSFQRPRILRATLDYRKSAREVTALAGLIKANLGCCSAVERCTSDSKHLHGSPGEREPAARLPRNPTGGPLGLLKPDFPAKQIPSDFYEQASLKALQFSYPCTSLPATLSAQDPIHTDTCTPTTGQLPLQTQGCTAGYLACLSASSGLDRTRGSVVLDLALHFSPEIAHLPREASTQVPARLPVTRHQGHTALPTAPWRPGRPTH